MIHEGLHRRKDGSTYPVEYIGLSYVELDKAYIVSVACDVSERKELHERLQLFRSLIDQSNDAIEVIDPHTFRVLDASQGTWESLGYARDEYLGMSVFGINPISMRIRFTRRMKDSARPAQCISKVKDTGRTGRPFPSRSV